MLELNLPYLRTLVQLTFGRRRILHWCCFLLIFFLLLCFAMSWWNSSHARRSSARYKIASSSALQHSVLESVSKFIKTIKPNKKKYSHIWHWFNSKYWHHTLHSLSFWPYRTCSLPVMTFCNLQIIWQAHNDNPPDRPQKVTLQILRIAAILLLGNQSLNANHCSL